MITLLEEKRITVDRTCFEHLYDNQKNYDGLREDLRIACLGEANKSILMWSHYASNHSGFCIEYDFSNDEFVKEFLFPVLYNQKKYIVKDESDSNWVVPAAVCKSPEWQYEKEWRIIKNDALKLKYGINNSNYYISADKAISAIYVGAKISKENLEEITQIAEEMNIPIYKMKMCDEEYLLKVDK